MSRFPECPWRLPDGTTVNGRLEIGTQLAIEATNSPVVRAFAFRIRDACWGCTQAQFAERILSAVQNVGYVADFPGDWMQPVEHTLEHGGDCEDLTGLLLAVCWILGVYADNVWLDQPDEPLNHVTAAIGLPDGEAPLFRGAISVDPNEHPDMPQIPGITWWWADTTVTGAYFGEWVYDAADRLDHNEGIRSPGAVRAPGAVRPSGYDYRTDAERQSDAETVRALTFVGNVIQVAGQTVVAIIASGNRQQLALLQAAASLRLLQVQDDIRNAAVGPGLELLRQQERALIDAKQRSEAALAAGAAQTQMYVAAGLAAVAILAGTYIYVSGQNQKKAA